MLTIFCLVEMMKRRCLPSKSFWIVNLKLRIWGIFIIFLDWKYCLNPGWRGEELYRKFALDLLSGFNYLDCIPVASPLDVYVKVKDVSGSLCLIQHSTNS